MIDVRRDHTLWRLPKENDDWPLLRFGLIILDQMALNKTKMINAVRRERLRLRIMLRDIQPRERFERFTKIHNSIFIVFYPILPSFSFNFSNKKSVNLVTLIFRRAIS